MTRQSAPAAAARAPVRPRRWGWCRRRTARRRPAGRRRAGRRRVRRELAPVVAGAVAALDEDGGDAGGVGLGDERWEVAAGGLAEVPDPHALAFEGAAGWRGRGRGRRGLGQRGVQRVGQHGDGTRPVGLSSTADEHDDAPRVGAGGQVNGEAGGRLVDARDGRVARDAGVAQAREGDAQALLETLAAEHEIAAHGYLMGVGGAVGRGRAARVGELHEAPAAAGGAAGGCLGRGAARGRRGAGSCRRGAGTGGGGAGSGRRRAGSRTGGGAPGVGRGGAAGRVHQHGQQRENGCRGQEPGALVGTCACHQGEAGRRAPDHSGYALCNRAAVEKLRLRPSGSRWSRAPALRLSPSESRSPRARGRGGWTAGPPRAGAG